MSGFILHNTTAEELCIHVTRQLSHFFPDNHPVSPEQLQPVMGKALERIHACFTGINNPKKRSCPYTN